MYIYIYIYIVTNQKHVYPNLQLFRKKKNNLLSNTLVCKVLSDLY